MQYGQKAVWSIPYVFVVFFPSLKQNFIAYHSSKVSWRPDCIFEIPQLWQSGFSRVYSNCCCSCSFKPVILKIGQSSHKMYSNDILNFQESTTKVWKLIVCTLYVFAVWPTLACPCAGANWRTLLMSFFAFSSVSHILLVLLVRWLDIGIMVRVFANGLGDLGSIPGQVIPKTQKMAPCLTLSILKYRSKENWSNPGKEVVPSPTSSCSSYRKGSLRVTLNYGCQQLLPRFVQDSA